MSKLSQKRDTGARDVAENALKDALPFFEGAAPRNSGQPPRQIQCNFFRISEYEPRNSGRDNTDPKKTAVMHCQKLYSANTRKNFWQCH